MRLFEDDLAFLPAHQTNWVTRFYSSWHYRHFTGKKSVKQKKMILSAYLSQLVTLMKDSRNEIAFLRKFLDRSRTYEIRCKTKVHVI